MRTEMLFFNASQPPTEAQQAQAYRGVFEAMHNRPITVRTLDLGGDKPPSFMDFPTETNPFLGWRGIRVSLDHPDMLKTQLRAILQAAAGHHVRIMYPMVESLDTLHRANAIFAEVRSELDQAGIEYPRGIPVGIMVETPSAAIMADVLATECDFFSIGTNDLIQYTLAADRNEGRVARYYRGLSPAVLRLIQITINAAKKQVKPVSICGELAGQTTAIPILLGMGMESLSMFPAAVPQAKWLIRQLTLKDMQYISEQALTLSSADEIETYVSAELRERGLLLDGQP
jgi:phosphocarrier protein FPr